MTLANARARWLLLVAVVLIGAGLYAFVVRGASQPKDPYLGATVTTGTQLDLAAPGDPARVPLPGFGEVAVSVQPASGGTLLSWCLLAALSSQQRQRGLMTVKDLHGYSGMVFVYAQDTNDQFYMRNTPTALSIAFIDKGGAVVSTADMAPCADREGCPLYTAAGPYRLAVEVPKGNLPALGIAKGATVSLSGTCAPRNGTTGG